MPWQDWRYAPISRTGFLGWLAAAVVVAILWLLMADAPDHMLQDALFDPATQSWLVDRDNRVLRLLFYSGPKGAVIAFGVVLIVALLAGWWRGSSVAPQRRAFLFVVVCLAVIPALTGALKTATAIACPYQLSIYGGAYPHHSLQDFREPYPPGLSAPRCFPAGHPSGGFALLGMVVVASRKRRAAVIALMSGGLMSGYQIARGAHYLSHCLATLLLSLLMVLLLHALFSGLARWRSGISAGTDRL
jgi:membrane-associated PAP2 superfamily phosphatase